MEAEHRLRVALRRRSRRRMRRARSRPRLTTKFSERSYILLICFATHPYGNWRCCQACAKRCSVLTLNLLGGIMNTISRRELLLSIPALALAPRMFGQDAPPPIPIKAINYFTLNVSDMKRSVDFYQGLFG